VRALAHLPELASYQDEPRQRPSGSVGKNGFLRLGFQRRAERTVLTTLERRVPLLVQQALYWDGEMPGLACVPLVTTSGCLLQGDRHTVEVDVGPRAQAHLTTQAATKIHSMDANFAAQTQRFVLADEAYLEVLPDPLIPHARSRFVSQTVVSVAPTATLLYAETLLPGRKHHKAEEMFGYDLFSSTVRAERPSGEELFTEKLLVEPKKRDPRGVVVMGDFDVFANVLFLTPRAHADRVLEQVESRVELDGPWVAGIGRLPGDAGLVYKVLGRETAVVKQVVRSFWALARREVTGAALPDEFLWR
jgi:urease accessory protein